MPVAAGEANGSNDKTTKNVVEVMVEEVESRTLRKGKDGDVEGEFSGSVREDTRNGKWKLATRFVTFQLLLTN